MKEISDTGFFEGTTAHNHHGTSLALSNWLIDYLQDYKEKQIYDFGCGLGVYLENLKNAGFTKLEGFEGDPPAKKVFQNITKQDLAQPFILKDKGLIITLEVAEHIPPQYEHILLNNICNNCDGKLIMSWALRGQPGHGHFNCLNNDEVIYKMKSIGFEYNETDSLSARNCGIEGQFCYFKNTIMIFEKLP